jgi:hypothetical protein
MLAAHEGDPREVDGVVRISRDRDWNGREDVQEVVRAVC